MKTKKRSCNTHEDKFNNNGGKFIDFLEDSDPETDKILVKSEYEAEVAIGYLAGKIKKGVDWEEQIEAINKGCYLIKGGALDHDVFVKNLISLNPGLSAAVTNFKTALVTKACNFICELAYQLQSKFDIIGNLISALSTHLSCGTACIVDACRESILTITQNCPTRKILSAILDLGQSRGAVARSVAAEAVVYVVNMWPSDAIGTNWPRLITTIEKLLAASDSDCRMYGRRAAKALKQFAPKKAQGLFAKLDIRVRIAIEKEPDITDIEKSVEESKPKIVQKPKEEKRPSTSYIPKPVKKSSLPTQKKVKIIVPKAVEPVPVIETPLEEIDDYLNEEEEFFEEEEQYDYPPPVQIKPTVVPKLTKPRMTRTAAARNSRFTRVEEENENSKFQNNVPEPSKKKEQKKKKETLALVEGQERSFINTIKDIVESGRIEELASRMEQISKDVLTCCVDSSQTVAVSSLTVLHDIVPRYSAIFSPRLGILLQVLIGLIDEGSPRVASNAQLVLQDLYKSFDSNHMIVLCADVDPCKPLLNFLSSLADMKETNLMDEKISHILLNTAFACFSIGELRNRNTSAHVIERVNKINSEAIITFADELDDEEFQDFENFIKPYIPDITLRTVDIDVPRVHEMIFIDWVNNISDFSKRASECEWKSARAKIYQDFNTCMQKKPNGITQALFLLQTLIREKGCIDFCRLLPGLFSLISDQKCKRFVESILSIFQFGVELDELILAFQPLIRGTNNVIAKNVIEFQTKIISTASKRSIYDMLSIIIPPLTDCMNHDKADIRKASMLCFVELFVVVGRDMSKRINHLTAAQQELISVYLSKR